MNKNIQDLLVDIPEGRDSQRSPFKLWCIQISVFIVIIIDGIPPFIPTIDIDNNKSQELFSSDFKPNPIVSNSKIDFLV